MVDIEFPRYLRLDAQFGVLIYTCRDGFIVYSVVKNANAPKQYKYFRGMVKCSYFNHTPHLGQICSLI